MTTGFIDDGYTLPGYIKPLEGVHSGLRFDYRPMLHAERTRVLAKVRANLDLNADAVTKAGIEAVKSHLASWDLRKADDSEVDVTEANLARVEPRLFERLRDVIIGIDRSDEPPAFDEEKSAKN